MLAIENGLSRLPGPAGRFPQVSGMKVEFDALYPGYWMIHCHLLYHQAAGMMTVLHYEGFTNGSYDPLASAAEFPRR